MRKKSDSAPEFVRFIGPLLAALEELGGSGRPDEVRTAIAKAMNISEAEQARRLPSGVQSRFENQVHWARFYLAKGGYIDSSRHGVWALTEKARGLGEVSLGRGRDIYRTVAAEFRKSRARASVGRVPGRVEKGSGVIFRSCHHNNPAEPETGGLRRGESYQGRRVA